MRWLTDENGERFPEYSLDELRRIARACWGIHALLPHPDDVLRLEDAPNIREFNRAIKCLPPLVYDGLPRTPAGHINNCALVNNVPVKECQMCKGSCPDAARFRTKFRLVKKRKG